MDSHAFGTGHFLGEGDSASSPSGTSLAVAQFTAFAFGWAAVHAPSQPWRVTAVVTEERYCFGCYGVRVFDVILGDLDRKFSVCRCCRSEVMHG